MAEARLQAIFLAAAKVGGILATDTRPAEALLGAPTVEPWGAARPGGNSCSRRIWPTPSCADFVPFFFFQTLAGFLADFRTGWRRIGDTRHHDLF